MGDKYNQLSNSWQYLAQYLSITSYAIVIAQSLHSILEVGL